MRHRAVVLAAPKRKRGHPAKSRCPGHESPGSELVLQSTRRTIVIPKSPWAFPPRCHQTVRRFVWICHPINGGHPPELPYQELGAKEFDEGKCSPAAE